MIFIVDNMQNRFKNCRDIVAIMIKQNNKLKLFYNRIKIFIFDYDDKNDMINHKRVRNVITIEIELIVQFYIQNV